MEDKEYRRLKWVYRDIIAGFSHGDFFGSNLYIKHFSLTDQAEVDHVYDSFYDKAIFNGVPTEAQRLEFLSKTSQWTEKDESELKTSLMFIDGLRDNQKRLYLKSQVEDNKKLLREEEAKYYKKIKAKNDLIGVTAESFSKKKLNDYYIYYSVFKDQDLKSFYFNVQDYEDMDVEEFYKVEEFYYRIMSEMNMLNIKKLALSPMFQNVFYLSQDNPMDYYGKPICKLSIYQTELFSYGRYFKTILDQNKNIPNNLLNDPDGLITYVTSSKNLREIVDKRKSEDGGATAIVGATKDDLNAIGVKDGEGIKLSDAMKGKKSLSMQDMLKLHGHI